MNIITKKIGKLSPEEFFYRIGKMAFVPFVLAGVWFAQSGYERYKSLTACWVRRMCALPCPGCGGTRAFYYLFRGELVRSLQLNPAVIFFVLSYIHFMLRCFYRRHMGAAGEPERQKEIRLQYYAYAFTAVLLIQWIFKLIKIFC